MSKKAIAVTGPAGLDMPHGAVLWPGGIRIPSGLTVEQAFDIGRELLVITDAVRWGWWEWLVYIEDNFGKDIVEQSEAMVERQWGWSTRTMANGRAVVRAFPESARWVRVPGRSTPQLIRTMTAAELAGWVNKPRFKEKALALVKLSEREGWTRDDLRAAILEEFQDDVPLLPNIQETTVITVDPDTGEIIELPALDVEDDEPKPQPPILRKYNIGLTISSLEDYWPARVRELVYPALYDRLGDLMVGFTIEEMENDDAR